MRWLLVVLVSFSTAFSSATAHAKNFRWCTVNTREAEKCQDFKKALPGIAKLAGVDITPDCVNGTGEEDCMKKIKDDKADFVTLDGGKIHEAGKCYNLVPIVAEDYGPPEGISYYSVAVARSNTNITFKGLKGRKSCHTGYRRTAGWNIPVGRLLEEKIMDDKGEDARSASAFFSQSCVPGVRKEYDNLCQLCPTGSGCSSDSTKNRYSGYSGAFRCMAENKGEVAFVKHLTTREMTNTASGYGNMSDYKYLCTDGTSKVVTASSHESCNLGSNPSHAVVGRPGENTDIVKVLLTASMYCQQNKTDTYCSGFLIFDSKKYGYINLLFKDSTKKLVDVGDKKTYKAWLGDGYVKAMEALGNMKCESRPVTTTVSPKTTLPSGAMNVDPLPTLIWSVLVLIKAVI